MTEKLIDYLMETPNNTNRSVVKSLLNQRDSKYIAWSDLTEQVADDEGTQATLIKKEFIPEIEGGVTHWDDLEGKPFYFEEQELWRNDSVEFLEEQEYSEGVVRAIFANNTFPTFENGTEYKVLIDEKTYIVIGELGTFGSPVIGAYGYDYMTEDMPFHIANDRDDESTIYILGEIGEIHSIAIYTLDIKKMDVACLPNESITYTKFSDFWLPIIKRDENRNLFIEAAYHPFAVTMEDSAYAVAKYLTYFQAPNLTSISDRAFSACENLALTELPDGLTSIGNYAFSMCENLALTELPDGLTSIGAGAFLGCKNLALIELPEGLTSIGQYAFSMCENLALIELPEGLTSIGQYAFLECKNLVTLTFKGTPDSISSAFNGCTNLTTINVPWAEGAVAGAPWGATNATINYNYIGE